MSLRQSKQAGLSGGEKALSCELQDSGSGLLLTYSEQTGKDSRQSHVRKMVFWKLHLAMN